MIHFIVVGMPASGKNIARMYAEREGLPYFATGDIVRNEQKRRNTEATPEGFASLSTLLRGEDGLGVTRLALKTAMEQGSDIVFLEGMRSWPEVELVQQHVRTCVIAFIAPREERRRRIISRGRPDDSAVAFDERDFREIDYGTAIPIALADEYILNTATEQDALRTLGGIVEKYGRR